MSIPERVLWARLRGRRLAGLKFRRQVAVGPFVVDYLCEEAELVVELDGTSHDGCGSNDAARTEYLSGQGLRVVRFFNGDVARDVAMVCECIRRAAASQLDRPSPQPSPKGRGSRKAGT